MTRSLRRSRRAPKKNSDYNVGDIVEINRGGQILAGRLAQFLSEGTSPNPRWLVKFDGQPHKDEEMYERSFGKLISAAEEEEEPGDSGSPPAAAAAAPKRGGATVKPQVKGPRTVSGSGSNKGSGSSSGEEREPVGDESKDAIPENDTAPIPEGSNAGSDTSSNEGKSGRVSAREARSKRRQAKIDEEVPGGDVPGGKKRPLTTLNNPKKRPREGDGEVVKVKLLTGTLYLYRGIHRRVEFVRRV